MAGVERHQAVLYHLWGSSGCGKTQTMRKLIRGTGLSFFEPALGGSSVWWDGCEGSEILLLDDFFGAIPFAELMRVLDGLSSPMLQVKGGMVKKPHWKLILMTTNQPLDDLYPRVHNSRTPGLARRFRDFGVSRRVSPPVTYESTQDGWWPGDLLGDKPESIPWDPDFVTRHEVVGNTNNNLDPSQPQLIPGSIASIDWVQVARDAKPWWSYYDE